MSISSVEREIQYNLVYFSDLAEGTIGMKNSKLGIKFKFYHNELIKYYFYLTFQSSSKITVSIGTIKPSAYQAQSIIQVYLKKMLCIL